ncbi:MAG: diacylglycerol/lipid kinase family protein [Bacteroidota bacterium]
MKNNRWLIVVNQAAGAGKAGADWPGIASLLEKHNFQFDAVMTQRRLHAMALTRRLIEEKGYNRIIVVGGDGTMNEVINGVFAQKKFQTTEIMLGMISVGTGNDWARMFNLPRDYESAIITISQQKTFVQDAGLVTYTRSDKTWHRYFINIAGMGFGAKVVDRTNQLKQKGKSSPSLYLLNIFTSLLNYRSVKTSIQIDGEKYYRDVFSFNVGICKYNGGGMIQVPDAIPDDGLFNMTLIRKMGKLNIIANIKKLYNGTITRHSKVETWIGKSVIVDGPKKIHLETDGETLGHSPMEFRIIPRSVKVISGNLSA